MLTTHLEHLMAMGAEETATDVCSKDGMDVVVTKDYDEDPLQDSELTPPTETGSTSEDDPSGGGGSGWFGGIGSDFRNLATSIKDNLPPAIGGIANFVHESAMSIAAEIAEMERDEELEAAARENEENYQASSSTNSNENDDGNNTVESSMNLPWEVKNETFENENDPIFVTDEELMENILSLSLKETTFLEPFSPSQSDQADCRSTFVLDERRIYLIRRLLDIDENLAAMHARLSGRSDVQETTFWRNYFHHCRKIRRDVINRRRVVEPKPFAETLEKAVNCSGSMVDSAITENDVQDGNVNGDSIINDSSILDEIVSEIDQAGISSSILTDDSSLIPGSLPDDDCSYVIPSAPNSLNTFATTRSIDDLVLVGRE